MVAALIAVLLLLMAVTTLYEMALFSARQEHMRLAAHEGDRRGVIVMTFLRNPTKIIAALQLISTGAGIALGMALNGMVTPAILPWFSEFPERDRVTVASAVVLLVSTTVTLLLTNLIPKKIGYVLADPISLHGAWAARLLKVVLAPLGDLIAAFADGTLRLLRIQLPSAPAVREGDIRILLHQGRLRGTIDAGEKEIIDRIFELSELRVRDVMTPREDVAAIAMDWAPDRLARMIEHFDHSYLLVTGEGLDDVKGVIRAREVLEPPIGIGEKDVRPVVELSPAMNLVQALGEFRRQPGKVAVVREGERLAGMLTFNDLVAPMVGEMPALAE